MYTQLRDIMPEKLDEDFNKPVESIMRCEDFKSNFARRLSNRYTSRTSVSHPKQDKGLKLLPTNNGVTGNLSDHAPERIELGTQLSTNVNMEQNGEVVKPPDKSPKKISDMTHTEVTVLNLEVETLRWQLAQTEANRQMHIALLKQIVAFLNRVKEHIESGNNESEFQKEALSSRLLPRYLNAVDLPRSRSVVHVNKTLEYSLSTPKKIGTRKISKSISNVNGFKECNGLWNNSRLSLEPDKESSQKISEEMSRLVTLANTVLSTNIPDLAYSCMGNSTNIDNNLVLSTEPNIFDKNVLQVSSNAAAPLRQIEENTKKQFGDDLDHSKEKQCSVTKLSSTSSIFLRNSFTEIKPNEIDIDKELDLVSSNKSRAEKKNEINSSFMEDESGFSSMSSFQEIGIPIISIIPPSPCKETGFMEEIPDVIDEDDMEKWKTDTLELEKQTMKVFWV